MVLIILYFVAALIRPQDWVPGLMGLPTVLLLLPILLFRSVENCLKGPAGSYSLPQNGILILYILTVFLSTSINGDFSSGVTATIASTKTVVLFFIVVSLTNDLRKLNVLILALEWIIFFLAVQGIIEGVFGEALGGITPFPGYDVVRIRWYGDWDGPNVFGVLFVIGTGLTIAKLSHRQGVSAKFRNAFFLVVYFVALLYTNSRGDLLAFITVVAGHLLREMRSPVKVLIICVFLGSILLTYGSSRMKDLSSEEASAHERTWVWEQGIGMLFENPFLGVGKGRFQYHNDLGLVAHNNFVQIFSELGSIGYFCFLGGLWFVGRGMWSVEKQKGNLPDLLLESNAGLINALTGFLAATFFVVIETDLYYILLGLCSTVYLIARRNIPGRIERLRLRIVDLGAIGLIGGVIFSMIWGVAVKDIL